MLKFIPPKEDAVNLPRYASYVVGAGMKTHVRLSDAKNSWRNRGWTHKDRKYVTRHAFILENVEGEWFVLYEIPEGITETELPWYKEFYKDQWGYSPYDDYHQKNSYYQRKLESGDARIVKRPTTMSTDEYVQWRLAVEKERLGL